MPLGITLTLFFLSLILSIISSLVLARDLDKLSARFHFSEGIVGIVAALGADTPEIAAAVTALIAGQHDLGLGVVLGSNIFNLAALLGLSAVIAGEVRVKRTGLLFNGGVALLVTVVVAALLFGFISPLISGILLGVLFIPYVVLLALHPLRVKQLALPNSIKRSLSDMLTSVSQDARKDQTAPKASLNDLLAVVPTLVSIVVASIGMVNTAITLGATWHLSHVIIGTLILATLTGIPNMITAVRLALHGRGAAVVSESLNSNTLNALSGIFLPVLILGLGTISGLTVFALWWLLGMTVLVLVLASFQGGISRWNGIVVIGLYCIFVGFIVFQR
ncbi:MAG: hypothetical protein ABI456_02770 [Ktedonobacteraceae bacterium]